MKNASVKLGLMMITAALLTSCQRASDLKKTTYQDQATTVIAGMVAKMSAPLAKARSARAATNLLGVGTGQYDIFGTYPYQNSFTQSTPQGIMNACLDILINKMANTPDEAWLAALMKCGRALQTNTASTLASRYLSNDSQYQVSYLDGYSLPGQDWGTFSQNYNTYAPHFYQQRNFGFTE